MKKKKKKKMNSLSKALPNEVGNKMIDRFMQ